MLSCGPSSGKIIKTISTQIDNIDFHSFQNVEEFIHQCQLRHLAFDRLVFTSKFTSSEEDMSSLCDFVRSDLGSVEIVMILSKNQKNYEGIFKEYFDSPTYTVMYVDNPTTKCIVDAVNLPIIDVKARYYNLDKPKDVESHKNSKFGLFKGGKKNKENNSQNQNSGNDSSESTQNAGDTEESNSSDNVEKNDRNLSENIGDLNGTGLSSEADNQEKPEFGFDGFSPVANENVVADNSEPSTDDLDLNIGEYGMMHSDSGFVGDDDLSELEEYARTHNTVEEPTNVVQSKPIRQRASELVKPSGSDDNKPPVEKYESVKEDRPVYTKKASTDIIFVTGLRGSEATITVVNTAVDMSKEGKRVLIIDLDDNQSGVLSFIDVNSYYLRGCFNGIKTRKIYSEDGVDILSNGYDKPISNDDVKNLLSSELLTRYDTVIVDCPLDCLPLVEDSLFDKGEVWVCCIPDLSKLVETTMKLNDRSSVSLKKNIIINSNCRVISSDDIYDEDVDMLKRDFVFPNGCWLD